MMWIVIWNIEFRDGKGIVGLSNREEGRVHEDAKAMCQERDYPLVFPCNSLGNWTTIILHTYHTTAGQYLIGRDI